MELSGLFRQSPRSTVKFNADGERSLAQRQRGVTGSDRHTSDAHGTPRPTEARRPSGGWVGDPRVRRNVAEGIPHLGRCHYVSGVPEREGEGMLFWA